MDQVNGNGMFNGGMGDDDGGDEDVDEYFDDAGDIGYLPADHVSFTNYKFFKLLKMRINLTFLFEKYSL